MKNESFVCEACKKQVSLHPEWSARNHCPYCMTGKHVDDTFPWDRASQCFGLMEVVDFENRKNRWLVVIHECTICKKRIANKIAPDDEYIPFMRKIAEEKRTHL